jgi:ribosomal protein L37AE/L43A
VAVLITLSIVIAGFVFGFIAIYTIRRGYRKIKPTNQDIVGNMDETPCPWCGKREYRAKNPSFTCPKCGAVHHRSCWEEYGGCTTWECSLSPAGEDAKDMD